MLHEKNIFCNAIILIVVIKWDEHLENHHGTDGHELHSRKKQNYHTLITKQTSSDLIEETGLIPYKQFPFSFISVQSYIKIAELTLHCNEQLYSWTCVWSSPNLHNILVITPRGTHQGMGCYNLKCPPSRQFMLEKLHSHCNRVDKPLCHDSCTVMNRFMLLCCGHICYGESSLMRSKHLVSSHPLTLSLTMQRLLPWYDAASWSSPDVALGIWTLELPKPWVK